MDWNELMECYRGQGSYLLCQLPLIEKYDTEPMARQMLARIVGYETSDEQFRTPTRTLKVLANPAGLTLARLRDMGVSLQPIAADASLDANSTVLIDATTLPPVATAPAGWKTALEQGATVVVHGATPQQEPLLEALAGKPVRLTVQPYAQWEGRACATALPG